MKATLLSLAAAGLVGAQSMPDIPQCALACLGKALPEAGCGITDYACACKSLDSIMEQSQECFTDSCDTQELENAMEQAKKLCSSLPSGSMSMSMSDTGSMGIPESTAMTSTPTSGMTSPSGSPTTSGSSPTETGGDGGSGGGGGGSGGGDGGSDDGGSGGGGDGGSGGDGGGEDAAGKPAIGLAAAALAVLAAL